VNREWSPEKSPGFDRWTQSIIGQLHWSRSRADRGFCFVPGPLIPGTSERPLDEVAMSIEALLIAFVRSGELRRAVEIDEGNNY
jgi:hypothetical protein